MNRNFKKWFLAGLLAGSVPLVHAEDSLEQRLLDLDQKVKVLERKQEIAEEDAANKAKNGTKVSIGDGGFSVASNDGLFKAKFGGYVQADGRLYVNNKVTPGINTFLIRRARMVLEATLYKDYFLRLVPEFAGSTPSLQDAYGEFRAFPEVKFRIGKFKVPIDIERLQSDTNYAFGELGLTNNLTPNRTEGALLHGDIQEGVLSYALGITNNVVDGGINDTDTNSNKSVVGRVFAQPFKTSTLFPLQGLGVGIASNYTKELGTPSAPNLPSFKTDGQNSFFTYTTTSYSSGTVMANGQHIHVAPQLYYKWNSFGVLSQYVLSAQTVSKNGAKQRLGQTAWEITPTFVLTGEEASYGAVIPAKPFDPKNHQWGAWELALRYADLEVDPTTFDAGYSNANTSARRAQAYSAGVNWYLNKSVKIYTDFTKTTFKGGATNNGNREDENFLLSRFQFVF